MASAGSSGLSAPPSIFTADLMGGADTTGDSLANVGGILSIAGALNGAIGSFYAAKQARLQSKAAALSFEHEQFMANLDARAAEVDAQQILRAGEQQIGLRGLQAAQAVGEQDALTGAAGVVAGEGSAAEVAASIRLAQRLDAMSLNTNAVRQAGAARRGAVNDQNRALLAGVGARNLRKGADSISPEGAAATSLLGGAGQVADYWRYTRSRSGR